MEERSGERRASPLRRSGRPAAAPSRASQQPAAGGPQVGLRGGGSQGARGAPRAGRVRRRRAGERVWPQGAYSRDRDGAQHFAARATEAPGRAARLAAGRRAVQGLGIGAAGRDAGGSGDPGLASPRAPLPHSRRDPGSGAQSHEPQQHEQRGREGAHSRALG